MNGCPFCLGPSFHPSCAEQFHGTPTIPVVAIETTDLETLIAANAGKIGGVQPKLTLDVTADGTALEPAGDGRFIAKPQWPQRRHLPQNEHLSMSLARLVGIDAAACALLHQRDGATIYVTKRFDRIDDDPSWNYHLLDFCQFLDLSQDQKYDRPADLCAGVIIENSIDISADLARLFQLLVFSYWIGNGDLHLKNLSLLDRGGYRLSPVYDLACSYVFGDEKLALPVRNRQKDVPRREWLKFAAICRLSPETAAAMIDAMISKYDECVAMIRRSGLPADYRPMYIRCLTKRRRALQAGHAGV